MDYIKKIIKRVFQYQAKLVLGKYKPKIIAITGSVGKTLTREAVYLVLSKNYFVRKTEKSFTTELGLPLTILGCSYGISTPFQIVRNIIHGFGLIFLKARYPEYLILEIDDDKPGDLNFVKSLLSIDILIMTAIGEVPSHVESFYHVEKILQEKKSIVNTIKRDGVIVYNADDGQVIDLLKDSVSRKIACGIGKENNIFGSQFKILYEREGGISIPTGMSFVINDSIDKSEINIHGSVGIQNEYACFLAMAVGKEFAVSFSEIYSRLSKYKSLPGRMNIVSGIKESIIIDDSYNSSPVAMTEALSVFGNLKCKGRKIVVVGDMLELGKYSAEEHRKIAELIKSIASNVVTVGFRTKKTAEELMNSGFDEEKIISVDSSVEAGRELQEIVGKGDIVLVKGSQSMRMERVVEEVMRHPEEKRKVLVRQESEWLERME